MHRRVFSALLLLALLAPAVLGQGLQTPFVPPWNDRAAGPADFSNLNKPIGPQDRVVINAANHFEADGKRVRFLGFNFAGDSPFAPTNKADGIAARIAKFGVNNVRLHHMDAPWALNGGLIDYGKGGSRQLSKSQLERLHFMVSRLKAHGVYVNVNLLVGREFKQTDGLPAEIKNLDWKDQHILGIFHPPSLALQKEFATQLMTATNRFTGLTLAQDPVVSFVEIMNENGIIQKWLEGVLDKLPPVFLDPLRQRWNEWLKARYPTTAAMLTAWKAVDAPLGVNLLKNAAFNSGTTSWTLEQHGGATAQLSRTLDFNGKASARVNVTKPGSEGWHVQLNQAGLVLTAGKVYTVTFSAKSALPVTLNASFMKAHDDYAVLTYSQNLPLTTEWQTVTNVFQAAAGDSNARINFNGFGTATNLVWIADVRVQEGGKVGTLPDGVTLEAGNVPTIPFNNGVVVSTMDARKDWLRFLSAIELDYWKTMQAHLRDACHYPGLVFGSIIANSPPNIQSQLDVVDSHGYWQHPVFPGVQWDPNNWTIQNISIVNSMSNPLTASALQRVKGKPFTLTEYQHPSPNYYGAEGIVLAAAYGALQDWDGIWFFDYGRGDDSLPAGSFKSYFDTYQHPTKMANLLLAASLFRREDVAPARVEITLPLTPETEVERILSKGRPWDLVGGWQLGASGLTTLSNRFSMSVGPDAQGLAQAPPPPSTTAIRSDTQELNWNTATPGKGFVTVNTPRTKALVGFTDGKAFDLGGVRLEPGSTMLGWSIIGLTLTKGDAFTNSGSALLILSGQVDNTGMKWLDNSLNSVGSNWGRAPTLVEMVPATVTLPVAPARVKVNALNERGERKGEIPVTDDSGKARIQISTNNATIWYEILISQATGFQQWRFSQFTAAELEAESVSGPKAAPAGDGRPNLLKYALNLPAKTPASLPSLTSSILEKPGGPYLAVRFDRSKAATDVRIVPEVSNDLAAWVSGLDLTVLDGVVDNGAVETVTLRDASPLNAASARYLRLRVDLL